MVVRKQESLFVPVDGVIRVSDHPAVYESVPSSHCSDVLHGPDPRRAWWGRRREGGTRQRSLVDVVGRRPWNFENNGGGVHRKRKLGEGEEKRKKRKEKNARFEKKEIEMRVIN